MLRATPDTALIAIVDIAGTEESGGHRPFLARSRL